MRVIINKPMTGYFQRPILIDQGQTHNIRTVICALQFNIYAENDTFYAFDKNLPKTHIIEI